MRACAYCGTLTEHHSCPKCKALTWDAMTITTRIAYLEQLRAKLALFAQRERPTREALTGGA